MRFNQWIYMEIEYSGADFWLKKHPTPGPFHSEEMNCVESCIKFDEQTTEPQRRTSLWFCLHQHRVDKFVNDFIRCI